MKIVFVLMIAGFMSSTVWAHTKSDSSINCHTAGSGNCDKVQLESN